MAELECVNCGRTEEAAVQYNDTDMRIYLPVDEVEPGQEVAYEALMLNDSAFFEEPMEGIVLCAPCSEELAK